MKVYLPRWARKSASQTLLGCMLSGKLKLNVPQQRQGVSIMRKLQAADAWVDLGRGDRKFLANRIQPFLIEVEREAAAVFKPFWRIFLRPKKFITYLFRSRGTRLLIATLTVGKK
jgi:hypothetical protein